MGRSGLVLLSLVLALMGGCACPHAKTPAIDSQVLSTSGVLRLDVALRNNDNLMLLIGANRSSDPPTMPVPEKRPVSPAKNGSAGMKGEPAAKVTFISANADPSAGAPVVEQGWLYAVRPPAWPLIRTPAIRGGVPLSAEWKGSAQVAAAVSGDIERIFFLGAFNTDGTERPATTRLVVDDYPDHPSNPPEVELAVGDYAEARLVGDTLQIVRAPLPITDPNCPQEIKDLINQMRQYAIENGLPWNPAMVPAGAAGGGVGGSS
jgi:hypothetical protein